MKIRYLNCLALLLFSSTICAQINYNLEAGISNSKLKIVNPEMLPHDFPNVTSGYFISFRPSYHLGKKFKLTTDFRYNYEQFLVTSSLDFSYQFQYIRIAPQLEYQLNKNVDIYSGIDFGLKIKEQSKFGLAEDWVDQTDNPTLLRSDLGLLVGFRCYYKKIFLSTSYSFGIKDISNLIFTDAFGGILPGIMVRSRILSLGIGYKIYG